MKSDGAEKIDAIMIFAGTNDYNGSVPIGQWYKYEEAEAPIANGKTQIRKRRIHIMDSSTFKGRINAAMAYIKENFPDKQIILITPIHRGFAKFGEGNVQPDESFPNRIGEYIDSYVDAVKEAGNVWAVPVIDLNSLSGLFPNTPSHAQYFHKKDTDLLHPNAKGHEKMASAIAYALACNISKIKYSHWKILRSAQIRPQSYAEISEPCDSKQAVFEGVSCELPYPIRRAASSVLQI